MLKEQKDEIMSSSYIRLQLYTYIDMYITPTSPNVYICRNFAISNILRVLPILICKNN